MEQITLYIKHDEDMKTPDVLRQIADAIEDGKIRYSGIEFREEETYLVKDCGDSELLIYETFPDTTKTVLDMDGRKIFHMTVRKKREEGKA